MTEPGTEGGRPLKRAWTWLGLGLLLVFAVWWRGHTFGPTIEKRTGWALWPEMHGPSEPLDCDEAAYGYIGRRLADGAVMYRDLTENKPPGGYWLFALAVKLGGANELTIRVIPVPMILLTVLLIFWIGRRVSGPAAGLIGGFVFVLLCTDPYLHGNGANLEHAMNLFAVASLAAMLASWKGRRGWLVVAGMLVGCSTLVKQVGAMAGPLYALAAWYREDR
ncbi:MAG TPA: glycosyltransferase family 39 protein, partial [Isosphaeraceae bacterium]|nr:glycosyltransferase family 39 protein [Isosphaeraceae bacterium]